MFFLDHLRFKKKKEKKKILLLPSPLIHLDVAISQKTQKIIFVVLLNLLHKKRKCKTPGILRLL